MKLFKTILCTVTLVMLLYPGISARDTQKAPLYGVVSGSVITSNNFGDVSGGYRVGILVPIDDGRGLSMRTLYTKAQWGDDRLESMQVAGLLSWYAGKKWDFYVVVGRDAWLSGDEKGSDWIGGFGATRRIYTDRDPKYLIPFTIDVFFDYSSDDTDGEGNVNQINFGLQFSRPVKHKK